MSFRELPGRALGVDYGTKRIGYAVSDELGWTVEPLEVWTRRTLEEDLAHLEEICREREIKRIVIGVPHHLNGRQGDSAERALAFLDLVRGRVPQIPVSSRDEALTSWAAEELLRERGVKPKDRKKLLDAYAAMVILREDLDARSRRPRADDREE